MSISVKVNVQPIAFDTYRFVMRAVAGPVKSVQSEPSDDFERVPGPPSKPRVGG